MVFETETENPVQAIRRKHDLSAREFAVVIGCSEGSVHAAEAGSAENPAKILTALARLTGEPLDSLRDRYTSWRLSKIETSRMKMVMP